MANKIKYGLSKCYYAVITYGANGVVTYGTPVAMPGAVNLNLSPEGERNVFYADNIEYFTSEGNNGYTGTLELALVPDSFKTDVLKETVGANGLAAEYANTTPAEFALLFQFEGDDKASRHVLYRCTCGRPDVASQTKEATTTPVTETLNITAMPRIEDTLVKGRCPEDASAYDNWFTAVVVPA